jgi:hypothetical protein
MSEEIERRSFEFVNYMLRPKKQIERKVIIDILRELNNVINRDWWKKWARRGLTEIHPNYQKRYRKVFPLGDFGIEVPEIKKVKETAELAEEEAEEAKIEEE